MNEKTISAKPPAASKAPLSPGGEAPKKTTTTSAENRAEAEKLRKACLALLVEDYEEKECGGSDNLAAVVKLIEDGARAAREITEAVKTGNAATIAETLPHKSARRLLSDVLSVFKSPYYLERGRYNGEKAPTLESAWQYFEESWSELLDTMTQRFPAFAARISEVRLTSRKFGDRCDRRNLRLCSAEERARELGAANDEFENLERLVIPLFDAIAAAAPSLADNDGEDRLREIAGEVKRLSDTIAAAAPSLADDKNHRLRMFANEVSKRTSRDRGTERQTQETAITELIENDFAQAFEPGTDWKAARRKLDRKDLLGNHRATKSKK